MSPNVIKGIEKVLHSSMISEGHFVAVFEDMFRKYCNSKYALTTNSCTSSLHLALLTAGVQKGDEVITSPITFIATGLSILYTGAKVIFADVEHLTGNINPISIEEKITKKTKAIIVVHFSGYPCDLEKIQKIGKKYNIIIIEDAAHALGATYNGKIIGSNSDFTCFSFQSIKHVTTGDGGMITFNNENYYPELIERRKFGIRKEFLDQKNYIDRPPNNNSLLGFKYSMNEIAAAIGLANFQGLENRLLRRRRIASRYKEEFKNTPGIILTKEEQNRNSSYFFFPLLVEERIAFIKTLAKRGIEVGYWHQRIDKNTIFKSNKSYLPGVKYFDERQVALPIHDNLTDKDVDKIIKNIKKRW